MNIDEYWCLYCGQRMDPTDECYCSKECLSNDRASIFTSLPHTLPSNVGLSVGIGLRKPNPKPKATPATLIQMPETTTSLRVQNVPHLPFDILLYILDYAQHSDPPALCRVSKTFHDCASNILYRDISVVNILDVCKTLSRSPDLARRVKHFELTPVSREKIVGEESEYALVGNALRFMTHLRSLKLTMGEAYSDRGSRLMHRPYPELPVFLSMQPQPHTLFAQPTRPDHTQTLV